MNNSYESPKSKLDANTLYLTIPRDLPIKQCLFSFNGRLNRQQFWIFHIFYFCVCIVSLFNWYLSLIVSTVFLYPLLAVQTKRWHDINKSGWNSLIWFVPVAGQLLVLLEAGTSKGYLHTNKYGASLYKNEMSKHQ